MKITYEYCTTRGDECRIVGPFVVDRYRKNEAVRLRVILLDGPFVPNLVDRPRVHSAEVMLGRRDLVVDGEVLPPRETAVGRHEGESEAETLLKLFPEQKSHVRTHRTECNLLFRSTRMHAMHY